MLDFAIYEGDDEAYEAILEKYKNTKELAEVLKFYNREMPDDEISKFSSKMIATQDKVLMNTLEKFKIL